MRLSDDFKDEIRARIRLSDLIGRKVALKRQGREFAGLSPFKKEKTPSFFVNDEKKFYHCFASGEHGDAFDWLMKIEGLSFMEAAERLAGEAGLALPKGDPDAARKAERGKSLIEWMEAAQAFFEQSLRARSGTDARRYLESRGLSPDDWRRFGIGYAPDSRAALKDELIASGASPGDLIETGLLIAPDDGGAPYDRFRGRIMFPIRDPRGRLVAFGGRAMNKNARAKYLNSPETPIFHKGSTLYRYPEARKAAADPTSGARGLIVAEGYLDAIAFARAGLDHAVAPLGTALTEDQLTLLWRAGAEPVLCFDGDSAGRRAAGTAADRALPMLEPGRSLRFIFLPEGKDPDDLLREEGAGALRKAASDTRPLSQLLWDREAELEPLDDPDRRAGFRRRLRALLSRIANPDVREEYKRDFDARLEAMFGGARRSGGWKKRDAVPGPTGELKRAASGGTAPAPARLLLLAAIEYPEIAEDHAETLASMGFGALDSLRDAVLDACSSGEVADEGGLRAALMNRGHTEVLRRLGSDLGPMRAALGGVEASRALRDRAWTRLADTYMERSGLRAKRSELRTRLQEEIGRGDSDGLRRLVEAQRRTGARGGET
ncbi:DNA primase [Hyphobacterium marinum]|uniref:DNA primase n=1 Tax=Hyphobacterium marinum TaxID=3116574 RepID=A0ABU7LX13_9PROT|nr:DNA primase [Hyphobacterium sp. Y6023]MEE2566108.1 DNA primase [Hyphobacterium sp. Y6023]